MRALVIASIVVVIFSLVGCAKPTASLPTLALVNGTLIDGRGADPVKDAVVVIQGKTILAAGPRASVKIPPGAQVIDVKGGTILPGFFNAHVHGAYNEQNLKTWASQGVTTVRDLGTSKDYAPRFAFRNAHRDQPEYARLVAAGPMITVPDGYPIVPWGVSSLTVTTVDEARHTASQLLADGADVIKIPLESGPDFGRRLPVLTPEEAAAIVEVAHQRGTRVSAHVTVAVDLERALQAGVDDIAHMVVDPPSAQVIQRIVKAGIYWVPTIELWKRVGQGQDAHILENLRLFVEAGGKVALGTDYDGYDAVFDLGMPIHEILWMQEAGLTPMEIIVAGTRSAAYVCNLEKVLGTLEPGKIADILVVNGDPLADLNALTKVQLVIHSGEVIVNGSGE